MENIEPPPGGEATPAAAPKVGVAAWATPPNPPPGAPPKGDGAPKVLGLVGMPPPNGLDTAADGAAAPNWKAEGGWAAAWPKLKP
jgi:hypothetical protein